MTLTNEDIEQIKNELDGSIANKPVKAFEHNFERINVGAGGIVDTQKLDGVNLNVLDLNEYGKDDINYVIKTLESQKDDYPRLLSLYIPTSIENDDVLAQLDKELKRFDGVKANYGIPDLIEATVNYIKSAGLTNTGLVMFINRVGYTSACIWAISPLRKVEVLRYTQSHLFHMKDLKELCVDA